MFKLFKPSNEAKKLKLTTQINSFKKLKTLKVKAKFGSSLSERILRDWLESMLALLKLTCPLYQQTQFKFYWQYKLEIFTGTKLELSRVVDLRAQVIYPNYPEPIETYIEFDGLK